MPKKFIYICSPFRGDYEQNTENAKSFCEVLMKNLPDVVPIAPHLYFPQFLDDTDPKERKLGLEAGIALLDKCDEIWVYGIGTESEGMKAEIAHAKKRGIPIIDGFEVTTDIIIADIKERKNVE